MAGGPGDPSKKGKILRETVQLPHPDLKETAFHPSKARLLCPDDSGRMMVVVAGNCMTLASIFGRCRRLCHHLRMVRTCLAYQ